MSFAASAGPDLGGQEPEEEDNRDSVLVPPAVDKTYDRLINYVTISILSLVLFLILRRRTVASRFGLCPPISIGECLDRVLGVGPELAQAQDFLARVLMLRRLLRSCV